MQYQDRYDYMRLEEDFGGGFEDYHPQLPNRDPQWDFAKLALLICTSACALLAVAYGIIWGLPQ